jgi:hypothetical protein
MSRQWLKKRSIKNEILGSRRTDCQSIFMILSIGVVNDAVSREAAVSFPANDPDAALISARHLAFLGR